MLMATSPLDLFVSKRLKAGDKIRIGRNVTCELVIKNPNISGFHCSVEARTPSETPSGDSKRILHYVVQDLSSNGTWILRGRANEETCESLVDSMKLKLAKKLNKRSDERLLPGDCILLLAPFHKQCMQYVFTLAMSDDHNKDCILKQLPYSPSKTSTNSHSLSYDIDIKSGPSSSFISTCNSSAQFGVKRNSPLTDTIDAAKKAKLEHNSSPGSDYVTHYYTDDEKVWEKSKPTVKDDEEEMERCPSCWKLFPVTELPTHCPICQEKSKFNIRGASPTPTKDTVIIINDSPELKSKGDAPKMSESIESVMEQCPNCLEIFPLMELVVHAETCSTKMDASDGRVAPSLSTELSLEQCPLCLDMFSITELISHSEACRGITSSSGECISLLDDDVIEIDSVPSKRYTLEAFDRVEVTKTSTESSTVTAASASTVSKPCKPASSSDEVRSIGASTSSVDVEQCTHCLKDFPITELVAHSAVCSKRDVSENSVLEHCEHCLKLYPLNELVGHSLNCSQRKDLGSLDSEMADGVMGGEDVWGEPVERCMHCFKDFPLSKMVVHSRKCTGDMLGPKERFKNFLPSVHDLDAVSLSVLTDTQMAAVEFVMKKSKEDSERVQHLLKDKVLALGYTETDLERTLQWIRRDAPIIIHVNLDRALRFLVDDTHYRNLFETGTGSGCLDTRARSSWEDRIFNSIYSGSSPVDRVKYGVLNIVGDPRGVRSCYGYGDSFLQLKKVRLRTTFASADTSASTVKLSCCEHYGNVLYEYNNSELKAILDVATRKKEFLRSDMISTYKEIQIHGPVCLSENVDCIVVNERHGADTEMRILLDKFVENNKCNLIWMEPEASLSYPSFAPVTPTPLATHVAFSSATAHLASPLPEIFPPPPRPSRRRRRRRRRRRDYDYD